ncbi:putative solute:sodium symporter small subunit [compost metagenome]
MVAWFARDLRFDFFGWPFSFWVGAQGALVVYVLMAALYAWRMNHADGEADTDSLAAPAPAPSQGASRGTGADAA